MLFSALWRSIVYTNRRVRKYGTNRVPYRFNTGRSILFSDIGQSRIIRDGWQLAILATEARVREHSWAEDPPLLCVTAGSWNADWGQLYPQLRNYFRGGERSIQIHSEQVKGVQFIFSKIGYTRIRTFLISICSKYEEGNNDVSSWSLSLSK